MNTRPRPHFSALPFLLLPIILHFVFPIQMIFVFPFTLIGLAPVIVGLYINLQATRTLMKKENWEDRNPQILVTEGAFRYSRNPMYLGAIIVLFGLAILLGSLVSFSLPVIMFLRAHFLRIPHEEDQLKAIFGKEYLDYMKRVRRWI